jgi:hypothetical protein
MAKDMPQVKECVVTECSYNTGKVCHAMAIMVGDDVCPMCDTYTNYMSKGGVPDATGKVGACRTSDCIYNDSLECSADGINVGWHQNHAECMTFTPD